MIPNENGLERDGLRFFGTLSASMTHEMNNVLSVIDQVSGLIGDMVQASYSGHPIDPARAKAAQERLSHQVGKGVALIGRFNRFAHTVDDQTTEYDLVEETQNTIYLVRRLAEMKRITLEDVSGEEEITVTGDPFAVQICVFYGLQVFIEKLSEGERVTLDIRKSGQTVHMSMKGSAGILEKDSLVVSGRLKSHVLRLKGFFEMNVSEQGETVLDLFFQGNPG
jgi:hypothetical protein